MLIFALAATIAVASSSASTEPPPLIATSFEWPVPNPNVIPDLRVTQAVGLARDSARQATTIASEGRRFAAMSRRRNALRGVVGLGPHPVTVAAGTTMIATPANGESGPLLGKITYPSGARFEGLLSHGGARGVIDPSPESPLAAFSGDVGSASTPNPRPLSGIYSFRNDDTFTGGGYGIYESADGERRFIGWIDFSQTNIRPAEGIMEDRRGRLLAVVVRQ